MKKISLALLLVMSMCLFACSKSVDPEPVQEAPKELNVASLHAAQDADQLVVVDVAADNTVALTLYEKQNVENGVVWNAVLKTPAGIGLNGLGRSMQGDGKTPVGVFAITEAFGLAENPGTALPYTKINKTHYWNTDPKSADFGKLVSTKKAKRFSKAKSLRLADGKTAYEYAAVINYNPERTREAGSPVFLHCATDNPTTDGSIAVSTDAMKAILAQLKPGAKIIIAEHDNLASY